MRFSRGCRMPRSRACSAGRRNAIARRSMSHGVDDLYVGIDVGTSGVRACAVDAAGDVRGFVSVPMPAPDVRDGRIVQAPAVWWTAVEAALDELATRIVAADVRALA